METETKNLSKATALKIYNQLNEKGKEILKNELGKDFFENNDIDISYESACENLGYDPAAELPYKNPIHKRQKVANANMKLHIIRQAIGNHPGQEETKWFSVFKIVKAGLVFSHTSYEVWTSHSYAFVGSPFVFITSKEAAEFGKNNIKLYAEIYTQ